MRHMHPVSPSRRRGSLAALAIVLALAIAGAPAASAASGFEAAVREAGAALDGLGRGIGNVLGLERDAPSRPQPHRTAEGTRPAAPRAVERTVLNVPLPPPPAPTAPVGASVPSSSPQFPAAGPIAPQPISVTAMILALLLLANGVCIAWARRFV